MDSIEISNLGNYAHLILHGLDHLIIVMRLFKIKLSSPRIWQNSKI